MARAGSWRCCSSAVVRERVETVYGLKGLEVVWCCPSGRVMLTEGRRWASPGTLWASSGGADVSACGSKGGGDGAAERDEEARARRLERDLD